MTLRIDGVEVPKKVAEAIRAKYPDRADAILSEDPRDRAYYGLQYDPEWDCWIVWIRGDVETFY